MTNNNGGSDKTLKDGGVVRPSRRARTRFSLKSGVDWVPGDGSFAKVPPAADGEAVELFHAKAAAHAFHDRGTGNAKLWFFFDSRKVLPSVTVKLPGGGTAERKPDPRVLYQQTVLAAVKKALMRAPQLSNYEARRMRLTVTIPNVASPVHRLELEAFLRASLPAFAEIVVAYESDVIPYWFLSAHSRKEIPGAEEADAFADRIVDAEAGPRVFLVVDVGHGTTDMSLIRHTPEGDGRTDKEHEKLAATGRASGGQELNVIFAEFYAEVLEPAIEEFRLRLFPDQKKFRVMARELGEDLFAKKTALFELVAFIELLKAGMTEGYGITMGPAEQAERLGRFLEKVLRFLSPAEDAQVPDGWEELRSRLCARATLPPLLGGEEADAPGVCDRVLHAIGLAVPEEGSPPWLDARGEGDALVRRAKEKLLRRLKDYVRRNSEDLLEELIEMAARHEEDKDGPPPARAELLPKGRLFAVVAGRAASFKPLRHALARALEDLGADICVLTGIAAKLAVSRGAVAFAQGAVRFKDGGGMYGTYAVVPAVSAAMKPKPLFFSKPQESEPVREGVLELPRGRYWLVFSTRTGREDKPLKLDDETTARIRAFDVSVESKRVTFRQDLRTGELTMDGERVRVATYGSFSESIYRKGYPDFLPLVGEKGRP